MMRFELRYVLFYLNIFIYKTRAFSRLSLNALYSKTKSFDGLGFGRQTRSGGLCGLLAGKAETKKKQKNRYKMISCLYTIYLFRFYVIENAQRYINIVYLNIFIK